MEKQLDLPKRMEDLVVKIFKYPKGSGPYVAAFFDGPESILKSNSVIYSALVYLRLYKQDIPQEDFLHEFDFQTGINIDALEYIEKYI